MNFYKKLLICFILIFIFLGSRLFTKKTETIAFCFATEREMNVGEDITYVAKYTILKIGEVRLKILNKKVINGKNIYYTLAYIDSYSGLPFVDLHQIYESKVNSEFYSDFFKGIVKHKEYTTFTEYYFDYKNSNIRIKKGKISPPQTWTDSTTKAEFMFHDGLSIFYYARQNMGQKKSVKVPCFVNEKKVYTKINFYDKIEKVSIDNVDYPISCLRLDGYTDFISVFGLTGYFEGWFSSDSAVVPIYAKMKVIIGNISLELKEWKREGWKPPKYYN